MDRLRSSLLLLDSLMRMFSLATLDENVKPRGPSPFVGSSAQVSFPIPGSTGISLRVTPQPAPHVLSNILLSSSQSRPSQPRGCNCISLSMGHNSPIVDSLAPSWTGMMMWPEGLPEADFKKEECRRLVWSCVMTIATMNAYTSGTPEGTINLGQVFVREPENVSDTAAIAGYINDLHAH